MRQFMQQDRLYLVRWKIGQDTQRHKDGRPQKSKG